MSNYKEGQAVIDEFNTLRFLKLESSILGFWHSSDLNGTIENTRPKRPATEAEILNEAQKHGWVESVVGVWSPKGHMLLVRSNSWYLGNAHLMEKPSTLTLKEYCEEGLIAYRLITALNLCEI